MKRLILGLIILATMSVQAQVYQSENIHGGTNKVSYSYLSNQDGKELTKDLETYLGQFGKVNKPEKNSYRIQNLSGNNISSSLASIDVVNKSKKGLEKLEFFFLDKSSNAITDVNAESFVQKFIDYTSAQLGKKLLAENLTIAEEELKDAQKAVNKIEKSIESNLKEQQKLGKKLDSSPELLAKAMSEKEQLVTQIFADSTATLDDKSKSTITKASEKKDKEISKLKKDADKAEDKLGKKEDELEDLKKELQSAKATLKAHEKIFAGTKSLK